MFSLTSREQFLVVGIVAAMVVGSAVQHWRAARREVPALISSANASDAQPAAMLCSLRWSPKIGQVVKLGSPFGKDEWDGGQAEAVWG